MIADLAASRDAAPFWPDRLADLWPERPAVVDPDTDRRYSYPELRDRALSAASMLAALGVAHGDRVAILMHNGVEVLDLLFACGRLGAILTVLNWRLSDRELAQMVEDTEPTFLLAHAEYAELAECCRGRAQLVLLSGDADYPAADLVVPQASICMDDPWLILFTGGTTGMPKGAILTHKSITWNAINTVVSWGLSESDIGPSLTPMFHTGGFNVFTLPLLMIGGRVILPQRFDPAQALDIFARERPTVFFGVPTMFQMIAEQSGFGAADLSSLRWAICGGAPLPDTIAGLWNAKVRVFKQGYGLTEVGPNNFATSDEDAVKHRGRTVGKLTLFASARIVDDDGRDVPAGTPGELLLAGPHMCAGYWNRPEETAQSIRDGWFHTGDLAMRSEEGFYFIVDRKKDMIITGGENVYPAEVEAVLYAHPDVREAAVIGLPDAVWGEEVCAVVSLKADRDVSPDELQAYTRQNLAHYKCPKQILIVDDIPKSGAGKIVRAEAKKLAVSREPPEETKYMGTDG
jgi:fatty-acyl-CoA synthase